MYKSRGQINAHRPEEPDVFVCIARNMYFMIDFYF